MPLFSSRAATVVALRRRNQRPDGAAQSSIFLHLRVPGSLTAELARVSRRWPVRARRWRSLKNYILADAHLNFDPVATETGACSHAHRTCCVCFVLTCLLRFRQHSSADPLTIITPLLVAQVADCASPPRSSSPHSSSPRSSSRPPRSAPCCHAPRHRAPRCCAPRSHHSRRRGSRRHGSRRRVRPRSAVVYDGVRVHASVLDRSVQPAS